MFRYKTFFVFIVLFYSSLSAQPFSMGDPVCVSYPLTISLRPAIAVNSNDKIFVVWEERDNGSWNSTSKIYFTESVDGINWITPYSITEALRFFEVPDIAVDHDGYPHAVWTEWLGSVYYSKYDKDHWTEPQEIAGGSYSHILIDNLNRVHLFWTAYSTVKHTYFDGSTWSEVEGLFNTAYNAGGPLDVIVDGNNDLHIVANTNGTTPISFYPSVLYRRQYNGIWGDMIKISNDSLNSTSPQIEFDSSGAIIIVWTQKLQKYPIIYKMYQSKSINGNQWSEPEEIPGQDSATYVYQPSLVKVNSGEIYLIFGQRTNIDTSAVYSKYDQSGWAEPKSYTKSFWSIDAVKGNEKKFHLLLRNTDVENGRKIYYWNSDILTSINEEVNLSKPSSVQITNYPNPFNSSTIIQYKLIKAGLVKINVYDILGREVRTLENSQKEGGEHRVEFNANDLPSGIYLCRLQVDEVIQTIKMQLLK